jgi:hypothetical protein
MCSLSADYRFDLTNEEVNMLSSFEDGEFCFLEEDDIGQDILDLCMESSFEKDASAFMDSKSLEETKPFPCVSSVLSAALKLSTRESEAAPRVVSLDNFKISPLPRSSSNYSFDLTEISKNKLTLKRSADNYSNENSVASLFDKPSSFLRAALHQKNLRQERPLKKRKAVNELEESQRDAEPASLLHLACTRPNVSAHEIDLLLRRDAKAANKPCFSMTTSKKISNPLTLKTETQIIKERFTLPLNLAIKNNATPDVLKMLINAAPSVLLMQDGPQRETPLCAYLRLTPSPDVSVVDAMLLKKPRCAFATDRHHNTALHVACNRGVSIDILRHLHILDPKAWQRRNFHDKTPYQLVQQRTVSCSDEVSRFFCDNNMGIKSNV